MNKIYLGYNHFCMRYKRTSTMDTTIGKMRPVASNVTFRTNSINKKRYISHHTKNDNKNVFYTIENKK
jgi:hypothetical protein